MITDAIPDLTSQWPLPRTGGYPWELTTVRTGFPVAGAHRQEEYRLVDVHVVQLGPDGQTWVDGKPDTGAPLPLRCPVGSCMQPRTDYPGHLCPQPDGTELWRDWP